jgi:hypothetical protein
MRVLAWATACSLMRRRTRLPSSGSSLLFDGSFLRLDGPTLRRSLAEMTSGEYRIQSL